jgi:hypothetical protein
MDWKLLEHGGTDGRRSSSIGISCSIRELFSTPEALLVELDMVWLAGLDFISARFVMARIKINSQMLSIEFDIAEFQFYTVRSLKHCI